jgi:hypothetical protein
MMMGLVALWGIRVAMPPVAAPDPGGPEHAPWCDEPCSCGGGCPTLQQLGPIAAPSPAKPASRPFRVELTAGLDSSVAAIGSIAIGAYVARHTELVLDARLARAPLALVELREHMSGRRGLALEVAAGGWRAGVAGGGAAYVIGLGDRLDAIASTLALVDADGIWRFDAEAGVSLAW